MSKDLLQRTADVLEKVAEYFDREDQARQVVQQEQKQQLTQNLRDKIAAVTGETPSADVLNKIASAGEPVMDMFTKLAARHHDEPPEELGEAQDPEDNNRTTMTKIARSQDERTHAERAFVDWIMS